MSKNRRKLRPHETGRRDQAMAWARETARDPDVGVMVTDHVVRLLYGTPDELVILACEPHYRELVDTVVAHLAASGDPRVEIGPTWEDEP